MDEERDCIGYDSGFEAGQEAMWDFLRLVQAKLDAGGRVISMEGIFVDEIDSARRMIAKVLEDEQFDD